MSSRGEKTTEYQFSTLDVFTSERFAGNQLGLVRVPTSSPLTQVQKQKIAREFNYSETVFLHVPNRIITDVADANTKVPEWDLDIFLVDAEVPFAGHPVIGAAVYALSTLYQRSDDEENKSDGDMSIRGRFKCKAGAVDLLYFPSTRKATARIPHEIHFHESKYDIETLCKLQPGLRQAGLGAQHVDVVSLVQGMTFIFVEVEDLETLGRVGLHAGGFGAVLDRGWEGGQVFSMFYVRTSLATDEVVALRTRMIEGQFEDAATGSASSALGAMLAVRSKLGNGRTQQFHMVQGVEMGRRSEIGVSVTMGANGEVDTIELSGTAVKVMEGVLEV